MGVVEDVRVRVKLLNSTNDLPDDQKHEPSKANTVAEFPLSLSVNETVFVALSWSIMNAESRNGSTVIKSLMINEHAVEVTVSDLISSFRIIIELWVQDPNSKNFVFGWESKEGFSSASIYMGFKLNLAVN